MANDEHVKIIKQGVEAWNKWSRENLDTIPDFVGANLSSANLEKAFLFGADLSNANLSHANLSNVELRRADLSNANLSNTNLGNANLVDANLNKADLTGASLYHADFSNANLSHAGLSYANLTGADLSKADLTEADLTGVFLSKAVLGKAVLSKADLTEAQIDTTFLSGADLSSANLSGAILLDANLSGANLENADFTGAHLIHTIFANTDLSIAIGLVSADHLAPSEISIGTLYKSAGKIPESFLRGCGLRDWEIENVKLYRRDLSPGQISEILYNVHELRANPVIQFNSCFISYSSSDQKFSEKLYSNLQDKGVRCWFAPEHMRIGDKIRTRIDEAIRLQDKLLLVLSETSIESQWVEQEVETALEKERDQRRTVLCPIMLDKAVMSTNASWASYVKKTRHIGDFSQWNDKDAYQKAVDRLLRDLRTDEAAAQN